MEKNDFVELVFDVFGDIQNDKRKSRIFSSLMIEILKFDLFLN